MEKIKETIENLQNARMELTKLIFNGDIWPNGFNESCHVAYETMVQYEIDGIGKFSISIAKGLYVCDHSGLLIRDKSTKEMERSYCERMIEEYLSIDGKNEIEKLEERLNYLKSKIG